MEATLQQPSLLLVVFEGNRLCIIIKISGILFGQLWVKPWNCEREVKNSQNLYTVGLWKYDTTIGHVLCVISCISARYFLILRHSGVFEPTLMAHRHNSNDSRP